MQLSQLSLCVEKSTLIESQSSLLNPLCEVPSLFLERCLRLLPPFGFYQNFSKHVFYQSKLTVLMRKNGFQQFSERLEWFGALFKFLKNFLWLHGPLWSPQVMPVVPPLHFTKML